MRNVVRVAWSVGLAFAMSTGAHAASLNLTSGQSVSFDTDTGSYSGAVSGTGSIVGGAAVFQFDSIHLADGVNVTFTGSRAVSLRSDGNFTLETVLNVSGGNGGPELAGSGTLNGWNGGGVNADGFGTGFGHRGEGSGDPTCCGGGGGGGYGGEGGDGNSASTTDGQGGVTYGDAQLSTVVSGTNLLGGSGGGGGTAHATGGGGGGGAGGIELLAGGSLTIASSGGVLANGGQGGGVPNVARGGGGGSGGTIRLEADAIEIIAGGLVAAGGGDGGDAIAHGRGGGGGAGGRVLLVATSLTLAEQAIAAGSLGSSGSISVLGGEPGREANNTPGRAGQAGSNGSILYIEATAIPEPGTLMGWTAAIVGLAGLRRR